MNKIDDIIKDMISIEGISYIDINYINKCLEFEIVAMCHDISNDLDIIEKKYNIKIKNKNYHLFIKY